MIALRIAAPAVVALGLLGSAAATGVAQHHDTAPPPPRIDPEYPDLMAATPAERREARGLWRRSKRAAKRMFPTPAAARRRGYNGHPGRVQRPRPFFFHFRNNDYVRDGRELDPRHPEAIVYWYDPPKPMVLVAFMYRAREGQEPDFGGPIIPWHSHCDGWSVVMHTWFTNDLRSGFARLAPRPELATTFERDFGDPTPDSAAGCGPQPPA
jgi:hypothetical protein